MESIWKGVLSPTFVKGVISASFNAENREEHMGDPDSIYGTLSVTFHNGGPYEWTEVTYQEFLDFEESGFSTSWLWDNLPLSPGRR